MSNIWKFSPSSEYLVKKCLEAGSLKDESNKWVRNFLQKENNVSHQSTVDTKATNSKPNLTSILITQETTTCDTLSMPYGEDFIDNIETDPVIQIKTLEYSKNTKIFIILAQRLSVPTIEKICKYVFDTKNMDTTFIGNFILHFFSEYLKRDNSRFTLDLILQAFKAYPSQFKTLLTVLLKDADVPCSFIQSLVQSLTEEEKLQFITYLIEIPLSKDEFVQNLTVIYLAYKDCSKSEIVQKYIFQSLKEYSAHCTTDKNYGKLFLTFLQTQVNYELPLDFELTNRLIEIHRSPFKRPCMIVYANLINGLNSEGKISPSNA